MVCLPVSLLGCVVSPVGASLCYLLVRLRACGVCLVDAFVFLLGDRIPVFAYLSLKGRGLELFFCSCSVFFSSSLMTDFFPLSGSDLMALRDTSFLLFLNQRT
jgi:hypothetical protein